MRVSWFPLAGAASAILTTASAASEDKAEPCTLHSANTGLFYDLRTLTVPRLDDSSSSSKNSRNDSWHARGWDYGSNFTLNVCAPVIEPLEDVVGVSKSRWGNVSAYYTRHGDTYSIGQAAAEPIFRGRKLVLNYTDGSPCGKARSRYRAHDDDEDDEDEDEDDREDDRRDDTRRKSSLIMLRCERDPLAPKVGVSFVGTSPDECTYFFELRAQAACGGARDTAQGLGPGGVFGVIVIIAVLVYLVGGCMYQRTVMHARGWRQVPNYSLWAGIGTFIKDTLVILTSSCGRLIPGAARRSSRRFVAAANGGRGTTPPAARDDENRLIDSLDEEWND